MAKLFDRVKMSVSGTPGTGNITLGSAVSGFRTFATAGVSNSDIVSYVAEDGTNWEIGTATYSTTGPALNSRTVTSNSAGDTNPISLTSSAVVFSAAVRADLVNLREANTFSSTGSIRLPNTGLKIEDTNASHVLTIAPGSDLTADRTLTVTTGDADRTLTLTASSSIGGTAYVAGGTDVAVADGGTGLSSYAAGDLVYASGTTTLAGLTVGAAGTILVGGAAPSYSANPQVTTIELGHATDTTLSRSSAGVLAVEGVTVSMNSVSATHTALGIELGHASDTTITRSTAGVIAVEGVTVPLNSITNTHTALGIELGHATDTTITRSSAGVIAVEGVTVPLNSITNIHTAQQIELGHASDTTITRSSAGVIAVEGVTVPLNSITNTHTALGIELGHATDTTITRASAGVIAVEGVNVPLNSITNTHTAQQIELGHASDTTITRVSAGVIAVEGVDVPLNSTTNTHTAQQLELGHATDTTLTRVSAGIAAVEGKAIQTSGKQTIWVPAGAMKARTTNGAEAVSAELPTNDIMIPSLNFDTATEEGAGFWITFPKSWNEGTVTFVPYWTAASGSGGVVWGLAAYAFSDDDALDTAVSGQQTSTDTFLLANDLHIGPESSAIIIGGTPAVNDAVYFEVTREVANGSDTLGVDAKLLGVKIIFTLDAAAANDD